MLLEQFTVSRKTPLDGKIEISPDAARRLAALDTEITVSTAGGEGTALLSSLECTCAKAAAGRHLHHFIESDSFRSLTPGAAVRLDLDPDTNLLRVNELP